MRRISDLWPGVRAQRRLNDRLARIEDRLLQVQNLAHWARHFTLGSSATYVGDNRILLRIVAGHLLFVLYVHADDKLISPGIIANGGYEPDVTSFFLNAVRSNSHCLDVGANVGYFTCLMANLCPAGRVIGLEPNPPVHKTAVDNLLVNGLGGHATILNKAASDHPGELTLFRRIGREGNTSMAACGEAFTSALQEPPEHPFQVQTVRVDDLRDELGGRLDFLKIDVEGAEPLVFAGARETIAANPQLQIVMEWAPAQVSGAGFELASFTRDLAAAGLSPAVIGVDRLDAISYDDLIDLPYRPGILLRRAA